MTDRLPYPPPFMDLATLALHVCAGESTIENWVKLGLFPAPKKIGGKNIWRWREVERHLAGETPAGHDSRTDLERITDATRRAAANGH
jgi:predicted DNA-binding transcriptional regulator AlpA